MPIEPLPVESLYRRCDASLLAFETTSDLEELTDLPGQARAIDAVRFGIGIKRQGYNLFVLGNPGSGKHGMTREFLKRAAASGPTPLDLCYVNNFEDPQRPVALRVPAGIAGKLRTDMAELVRDLKSAIPSLFESEDYRNRRHVIDDEFKHRQEDRLREAAGAWQEQESGPRAHAGRLRRRARPRRRGDQPRGFPKAAGGRAARRPKSTSRSCKPLWNRRSARCRSGTRSAASAYGS